MNCEVSFGSWGRIGGIVSSTTRDEKDWPLVVFSRPFPGRIRDRVLVRRGRIQPSPPLLGPLCDGLSVHDRAWIVNRVGRCVSGRAAGHCCVPLRRTPVRNPAPHRCPLPGNCGEKGNIRAACIPTKEPLPHDFLEFTLPGYGKNGALRHHYDNKQ